MVYKKIWLKILCRIGMPKRVKNILGLVDKMPFQNKKIKGSESHESKSDQISSRLNLISPIEVFKTPIKSANDKKDYRVIRLGNGLIACLVSDLASLHPHELLSTPKKRASSPETTDPETSGTENEFETDSEAGDDTCDTDGADEKMAGASLCIGVGSFSDPKNIQGLAHFLEHMVFMGSEKFPIENDFDSFLKKRGGSDNASTDCETTTFYFECQDRDLAESLDKLSNFFISPLLKRDAMTREREAVESEFQMALPSDSDRREQLLLSFAPKNHPVNTFTWGNLVTLRDNVTDDVLYESLHQFRKRHYSAHRMCLAIQARFPLDTLQQYVVEYFSQIPNNNLQPLDFGSSADGVFNTPEFKRMYYIKPVKDICQIHLTWPLPSLLTKYKSKPHQYVSWLLGHEGKGSLKSYLKKNVWVLSIEAGNGETGLEHNSVYSLFSVNMVLCDEGIRNVSQVLDAVFSFIKLLKNVGPQERIFKEIKSIKDTTFQFQTERVASDIVEELSENMHYYPSEHYLCGSELYLEYDPKAITDVLDCLQPETVNIMVTTSNLPNNIRYNKVEEWFKTPYYDQEIPKEWIEKWKNINVYDSFALPTPNIFLTNDFSILTHDPQTVPEYPKKILDNTLLELWYRADTKFKLPIAYMYFYFITPMSLSSAQTVAMVDCYVTMLHLQLDEDSYPAQVAELHYSFSATEKGIMLKLDGYNEKLPLLLELILKHMKDFSTNLTEDLFDAIKEKQMKYYYNGFIKPSRLVKDVRLSILTQGHWTYIEKHTAIQSINYDMMLKFGKELLNHIYIQVLIQGNMRQESALQVTSMIETILQCKPFVMNSKQDELPEYRVRQIPFGEYKCCITSFNSDDTNSMVTNYYQSGPGSIRELVIIEILMMIIEEPLFDLLRTKEQLGYHIFCTLRDTFGIAGYSITVNTQADKYSTDHVDKRIESFICHAINLIKTMPDDEFNQVKSDLIKVKLCMDLHLQEEVARNWSEITSFDYIFDRLQREVNFIKQTTKLNVIDWFCAHSICNTTTTTPSDGEVTKKNQQTALRKLSIQVIGHTKDVPEQQQPSTEEEEDNINSMGRDALLKYELKTTGNDGDITVNMEAKPSTVKTIRDIEEFKKSLFLYPVTRIKSD